VIINFLLIVVYLPQHNAVTPSNVSGLGYQLSQYDTPGVFRMYVSSVKCFNMKSATSAREMPPVDPKMTTLMFALFSLRSKSVLPLVPLLPS